MKILIAGAGEVGYHLIANLSKEEMDITVIDTDAEVLERLHLEYGINQEVGNIVDHHLLSKKNLKDTDLFIAITNSDETNMIACRLAKEAGALKTICRIRQVDLNSPKNAVAFEALGIDHAINPVALVAEELYQLIQAPNIVETHMFLQGNLLLIGYRIQGYCHIVGMTCRDFRMKIAGHTANIVLIQRNDRSMVATHDQVIKEEDQIYFLTTKEDHSFLRDILGYNQAQQKSKRIVINGGGHIGFRLAKKLEKHNHTVRVIELNRKRAYAIAERLKKALVLNFDGTDSHQLIAEGVEESDFFFAVTDNEDINIVSALLASQIGAERCILLAKQQEMISIVTHTTPIDVAISPRLVTARYLTQFVKGTHIDSYFSIDQIEVLEIHLEAGMECLGQSIETMPCFEDAHVVLILRGDRFIIPHSHDPLLEGDTIVLVMHRLDREQILSEFKLG